ncbi:alpha-amylase family glycosyl hydrolase, partial [Nonomuraea sp. NPDC004297]
PEPGVGLARARAALLTMLALPGSAYLYQGEELGLPEVRDLPDAARQDPVFFQSNGEQKGRDGCRVPIPWTVEPPSHGFSPGAAEPWLPQPESFAELSVEKQEGVADSTLEFYRRALTRRRELAGELPYTLRWLDSPEETLVFARGPLICAINCGTGPVRLPPHEEVLLTSGPLKRGLLPPDTAAWLRGSADVPRETG